VNPHRHAVAAVVASMARSESRATAQVLFEHYDESSGAHAGIDEILKAAGAA
jgi:hypothetical protein